VDTQTHRQQGDLIGLLTKIRGIHRQTDRQTDRDREQGDLISLKNTGGYTERWTDKDGYTDSKAIL
jgi:hypothetical protein